MKALTMEDKSEYTVMDMMFDIAGILDRKAPSLYKHQDECDACRIYDIFIDCINLDIKMLGVSGHQWCCISHIDGEQVYCTCDSEFDSWVDFVKHIEKVKNNGCF